MITTKTSVRAALVRESRTNKLATAIGNVKKEFYRASGEPFLRIVEETCAEWVEEQRRQEPTP